MLDHYKGTGGYATLYLLLLLSVSVLTAILAALGSALGVQAAWLIAGGVIFASYWIIGFVVMQRFIGIENRSPSFFEANSIGLKSVFYFFGTLTCLAILIALCVLLVKLVGSLIGADGGTDARRGPQGGGADANQSQQAIYGLWGTLATMFILYMAPFVNLALISRLFTRGPKKPA